MGYWFVNTPRISGINLRLDIDEMGMNGSIVGLKWENEVDITLEWNNNGI